MSEIIIKTENAVIRQQKNTILKNVNLEIKNGEFIYLIGKVGSGKSSFLKTLYAELPLDYGKIEVAGFQLQKIKKSQIPALRRKCGIVFQDFKLLTDRSVYANLEFVLRATGWNKKAIQERIESVLQKVEMQSKKFKMPHELSGGEQQRIVLARALLNAPPLILADEPTGNIDPETSYRLIELLQDICRAGTTVIIATHQYDLLEKYPGRVLRCENETLTEDAELTAELPAPTPEVTESIENIPLPVNIPQENELPSVLESDIETPEATAPEETSRIETPEIPVSENTNPEEINLEETTPEETPADIQEDEIPEYIGDDLAISTEDLLKVTTPTADAEQEKPKEPQEPQEPQASSPFGFELIE